MLTSEQLSTRMRSSEVAWNTAGVVAGKLLPMVTKLLKLPVALSKTHLYMSSPSGVFPRKPGLVAAGDPPLVVVVVVANETLFFGLSGQSFTKWSVDPHPKHDFDTVCFRLRSFRCPCCPCCSLSRICFMLLQDFVPWDRFQPCCSQKRVIPAVGGPWAAMRALQSFVL